MRQGPDSTLDRNSDRAPAARETDPPTRATRVKAALGLLAGCLLGLVLVAFGITAIDGKLALFLPLASWLVAGGIALAVVIFAMLLGANAIYMWTRGLKARPFAVDAIKDGIVLHCAPDEAGRRCQAALRHLPQGFEGPPEWDGPGTIVASTSESEKSFGEVVTIDLTPGDGDTTRVTIRSSSAYAPTMLDWGVNAENVRAIARDLETATAPRPAAATDGERTDRLEWLAIGLLLVAGGYAGILVLLSEFWPQALQSWTAFLDVLPFNPNRLLPNACRGPEGGSALLVIRSLNVIVVPIMLAYIGYWTIRYRRGQARIGPSEITMSCAALVLFPVLFVVVCDEPGGTSGWHGVIRWLGHSSLGGLVYIVLCISGSNLVAYLPACLLARLFKRRGG